MTVVGVSRGGQSGFRVISQVWGAAGPGDQNTKGQEKACLGVFTSFDPGETRRHGHGRKLLWLLHFYANGEDPKVTGMNRTHTNDPLGQDLAALIANLDEHRKLPGSLRLRIPDDAFDAQRGDSDLGGGRSGQGIDMEAALTCRTDHRTPEDLLSAVRTRPQLTRRPHQ